MGFLKSLFGEGKVPQLQGREYSIIEMYSNNCVVFDRAVQESEYPWTLEKQTKFFEQFQDEKFLFDSEVGCIGIDGFHVDQDLYGEISFSLYNETKNQFVEQANSMGQPPQAVGKVFLTHLEPSTWKPRKLTYIDMVNDGMMAQMDRSAATGKKLSVTVIKHYAAEGQPWHWNNRA